MPSVPALARGLHLMRLLETRGAATLEELVRATALPRSSLARMLETLAVAGVAERDAALRWSLTRHLVELPHGDPLARWSARLDGLAGRLGLRTELWRFDGRGCELAAVSIPAGWDVPLFAHPGWRADPQELMAPVQLWLARCAPGLPGPAWYWLEKRRVQLGQGAVRRLIDRVRLAGAAGCPARNHHAIRRWAVALSGPDGTTVGCLAAVRFCLRRGDDVTPALRSAVRSAAAP